MKYKKSIIYLLKYIMKYALKYDKINNVHDIIKLLLSKSEAYFYFLLD